MIYLDNAATTLPKPPQVLQAVSQALTVCGSLGRGSHDAARFASELAYECRVEASELFECDPEQVVFVYNATHGLNIAINTLVNEGDKVVVSAFEHNAVMRPLYAKKAKIVVAGKRLFDHMETIDSFRRAITEDTKAVICTHVSNVFGYVLPICEIADICAQYGIPFIVDAAQSAGVLPISAKRLHSTFVAVPGHKGLFGPQGTGILICRDVLPKPIMYGGTGSMSLSMEMPEFLPDRLEAGTQNIHGIAGLLAGIRYVRSREKIFEHENALIRKVSNHLCLERYRIFSSDGDLQSGVISICPHHGSCEQLASDLSEAGFAVRTGLHCAPLAHLTAGTRYTGTVRISVSALTKSSDIDELILFLNQ